MEDRSPQRWRLVTTAATQPALQAVKELSCQTILGEPPTGPFPPRARLLRDRQVGQLPKGSIQRFGFIRLVATQWHEAAMLLIDWDRAVNEGWPNLRSPSCPTVKGLCSGAWARAVIIPQTSAGSPEVEIEIE